MTSGPTPQRQCHETSSLLCNEESCLNASASKSHPRSTADLKANVIPSPLKQTSVVALTTSMDKTVDAYLAKEDTKNLESELKTIVDFDREFTPQSGWEESILKFFGSEMEERVYYHFENFVLVVSALSHTKTEQQATSVLMMYAKMTYGKSYSIFIRSLLIEIGLFNSAAFEQQGGDETPVTEGSWLDLLSRAKTNWKIVVRAPAFKKLSKFISICAALGLCNLSSFNIDIQGVRMFSVPAYSKHVSAIDFVSACMETFEYFVRGGYEVFVNKNFDALLYEDVAAKQFEDDFFLVLEASGAVKNGNLEKYSGMTENDYSQKLDTLIEKCGVYAQAAANSFDKKVMNERQSMLRKLRCDFSAYRVSGKLREAPYTFYLQGSSGVGKSYVSNLISRIVLKSNGFDASDDRFLTVNEGDKYFSGAKSSVMGIMIDDIGNSRPEYVEKAPTQKIIELCNNIPYAPNMADIESKGKISLEPKILMMTSNLPLKGLAAQYSMDVMSVLRRANVHIEQSVKPEFCKPGTLMLDSKKVSEKFGNDPYPDVWNFDVYEAVNSGDKPGLNQVLPPQSSLAVLIEYLVEKSRLHFENQKFVVENAFNLAEKIICCDLCKRPDRFCTCKQSDIKVHEPRRDSVRMPADEEWVIRIMNHLPDFAFNNIFMQYIATVIQYRRFLKHLAEEKVFYYFLLVCGAYIALCNFLLGVCWSTTVLWMFLGTCKRIHDQMVHERAMSRQYVEGFLLRFRNDRLAKITAGCAIIAVLYKALQYYKKMKPFFDQGNLQPTSKKDIVERDAESNPWIGAHIERVPKSVNMTTTREPLMNVITSNLVYMRFPQHPEGVPCCDAFFVCSNFLLIPDHMMYDEEVYAELYHAKAVNEDGTVSPKLRSKGFLSRVHSYKIPNTDLLLCYAPFADPARDVINSMCEGVRSASVATLVYRDSDGEIREWQTGVRYTDKVVVGANVFEAYKYDLPVETFNGLCMATLLMESKPCFIGGFHLGGRGKTGVAGIVTREQLLRGIDKIRSDPAVLLCHSEGNAFDPQYGKTILQSNTVHPNSCTNYIPRDTTLKVFGTTSGRAKFTQSDVITSPISEIVSEVCGVPQKWGPPKLHSWIPFYENLKVACNPSSGISPKALKWAIEDYVRPLLEEIQKPYWVEDVQPLTRMQILCGIDGKRFVDKMPPNTAIGFPLQGKKSKYLVALDPEQFPDFSCPMDIEPEFWEEYEKMEQTYLKGERYYPVFKASLKDEPTKLEKTKVRVFWGAPFALQAGVRKYFIPICRFLSMNPLLSECAVGINAQGPEWDQLMKFVNTFGEDRTLAGDYSNYDINQACQISLGAWGVMIRLAAATGNYTEDDLTIMRGLATDCCFPVVAQNGDLVQFSGVHISGINVTAYVGSIDNALLQRSCYKELHDARNLVADPYRHNVAVIDYGDDFKGSVSERKDFFNHITYKNWLAKHGMKLTMPDKKSDPIPYMNDKDADFLKRKNIYNPDLGLKTGALDKDSIYKSLHCLMKSNAVTVEEQCAQNIDGALREFFPYGKDEYEDFRLKMNKVAERASIKPLCTMLDVTYEDQVARFRAKYFGEELPPDEEVSVESFDQQGGFETPSENPYDTVIKYVGKKPIMHDTSIGGGFFGEVDLMFCCFYKGQTHFLLFEIKESTNKNCRKKGRKQVKKYSKVFSLLRPDATVFGFLVVKDQVELIYQDDDIPEYLKGKYPILFN